MNARHTLLLIALTGCPYVGTDSYDKNVRDADGDGFVGERFGGPDCQDDNPQVGDCDADRDGFRSLVAGGTDCDDTNGSIHPDAIEACDRVDNDCDGAIDGEDPDAVPNRDLWVDADGDGEGDADRPVVCQVYPDPENPEIGLHVGNADDCDDTSGAVNSTALELCDGIDNNCDGMTDDVGQWPRDSDGDGFGQTGVLIAGACDITNAVGVAAVGGDCDDMSADIHPDAVEIPYDGIDSNCNGGRDDWDVDFDGYVAADRFGEASAANALLPEAERWPIQQGDCDDEDPRRNVGAVEVCDGVDNDCDGSTDAADLEQDGADEPDLRAQVIRVFLDLDGDGQGGTETLVCPSAVDPHVHFQSSTDCFDALPAPAGLENAEPEDIHEAVEEVCDGFDNNCDGRTDWDDDAFPGSATFYTDADADGYGVVERQACSSGDGLAALPGDCDDADGGRFPGAPEICGNAVREDCITERCEDGVCEPVSPFDCDLDGVEGSYIGGGSGDDCNDEAAEAFPGNPEVCDGLDNDCNGAVDADDSHVDQSFLPDWFVDADADGFGDPLTPPVNQCNQPDNTYTLVGGDCDDANALDNPGAPWYLDRDGDGAGVAGTLTLTGSCASPAPVDDATWVRLAGDCNDTDVTFSPDTVWYRDLDDDGVGDPSDAATFCRPPAGESWALQSAGDDCDDNDSTVQGTSTFYLDADADGYGDPLLTDLACAPRGIEWVLAGTDCDDTDSGINPGKVELCNTIDDDCDGAVDDDDDTLVVLGGGPIGYVDTDDDGFGNPTTSRTFCTAVPLTGWSTNDADCDDTLDTVNPSRAEVCGNGIDDDCDGDEQIPTWFDDSDGDGFGVRDPGTPPLQQCDPPAGTFASREGDCNDADDASFPGAPERDACDGLDDDCDGQSEPALTWTFDGDEDGYGDPTTAVRLCAPPADRPAGATTGSWLLQGGDCDDADSSITFGRLYYRDADGDGIGNAASPQFACPPDDPATPVLLVDLDGDGEFDAGDDVLGASEPGDCFDDDSGVGGPRTFYPDADGDGWGSLRASPSFTCPAVDGTAPVGFTAQVGDCVDDPSELDPAGDFVEPADIFPQAMEILTDGQDNDCDGFVDDENAAITWFIDSDGDGFGSSIASAYGPDTVTIGGDCDDTRVSRHPAHPEICDGVADNDCDPSTVDPEDDVDNDGFSICDGDPDDTDDTVGPDQIAWYLDADDDGYGVGPAVLSPSRPSPDHVLFPGDCDDLLDTVNPAAIDDTCDGVDDNCNGAVDEAAATSLWYVDADGDLQGAGPALASCSQPPSTVANADDCDDTDPLVLVGGTEQCNGIDDDCDGSLAPDELDADGDGWLQCEECDDSNGARNPGQPESCDNVPDNDCDPGTADPELDGDADGFSVCQGDPDDTDDQVVPSQLAWYLDADADGFGGPTVQFASTDPGPAWTATFGDCDDTDDTIFPGAADDGLCDGVDSNCDGVPDDGVADDAKTPWFPDTDEDGEGSDSTASLLACVAPAGFVADDSDCDDADPAVNTSADETCDGIDNDCDNVLFVGEDTDVDGDLALACNDCDDTDAARFPGNPEVCDGTVDNDCVNPAIDIELDGDTDGYSVCDGDPNDADDTITPPLFLWFVDSDADGFGQGTGVLRAQRPSANHVVTSGDCDDGDPDVFPGAPDLVCGIDANCNGVEADDSTALPSWFLDADDDGHGRLSASIAACDAPAGFVMLGDDCNDADDLTFPGATEQCDGRDNDCDLVVPADETTDTDADQHPVCADCDDNEPRRYDGAPEVCDGLVDNDCGLETLDIDADNDGDGASECQGDPDDDNGSVQAPTIAWFVDADNDSFGGGAPVHAASAPSSMHTQLGGDCDDADATVYPGAVDATCDGLDQDCSGADGNNSSSLPEWFLDADDDGEGRQGSNALRACVAPVGYVAGPAADCDDLDATVNTGAPMELCDGKDTDCDGTVPGDESTDADSDGFFECEDCQDDEERRYPGHPEVCDGVLDNNCVADGEIEADDDGDGASECQGDPNDDDDTVRPAVLTWFQDVDGDGYGDGNAATTDSVTAPVGHVLIAGDCDDTVDTVYPGAIDLCDGVDDDCSGVDGNDDTGRLVYHLDADGDGEGRLAGPTLTACSLPSGYVANTDDCDDLDPTVRTAAPVELCDGKDTDCDGTTPANESTDADGDGYLACEDCDESNAARNAGHPEVCDGVVDNDCRMEMLGGDPDDLEFDNDGDGASECQGDPDDTDPGATAPVLDWYEDVDGDGIGGDNVTYSATSPGSTFVRTSGDCQDGDPSIHPGADDDNCDNVDDDCDGQVDDENTLTTFYADTDDDLFGDPAVTALFCMAPSTGWSSLDTDCDDTDNATFPGAPESCDGKDTDCDMVTELDEDGDGSFACNDCDDQDADTYPGAEEQCDGIDNNCDGGFIDLSGFHYVDVPNPFTGTGVDAGPFDGGGVLLGDTDGDGTPSVLSFEYMCDELDGSPVFTVEYATTTQKYDLFSLDGDNDIIVELSDANDCDTGVVDSGTTGTVVFADADSDGVPGAESPDDVEMDGCGQPAITAGFVPIGPLGGDCAPFDMTRSYQHQEGDHTDLDEDGHASVRPLTLEDLQNHSSHDYCVPSTAAGLAPGDDCDDRYADPDPAVGGTLEISDTDDLNSAFAHCDDVWLALAEGIVWDGDEEPRTDARLSMYSPTQACTQSSPYGCLDLGGNILHLRGTSYMQSSMGLRNGLVLVDSSATMYLDNTVLQEAPVLNNGYVDLRNVSVEVASFDVGLQLSSLSGSYISDSKFIGPSDATAIQADGTSVHAFNTSFNGLETGITTTNNASASCSSCDFVGVGVGMESIQTSASFDELACTDCRFDTVTTGMIAVGGSSTARCEGCTVEYGGSLIDNSHGFLAPGSIVATDIEATGSSGVPLFNAASAQADIRDVHISDRPLFVGSGTVTLEDIVGENLFTGVFIDYPGDAVGHLDVQGLEVHTATTETIVGSGSMELTELVLRDLSLPALRSSGDLEVEMSDVTIEQVAGTFTKVIDLEFHDNQIIIEDLHATDIAGTLFTLDGGTALFDNAQIERTSRWMSLTDGASVTVFDSLYEDSTGDLSDVRVSGSDLFMSDVRMLDVHTFATGQPLRDVFEVVANSTLTLENSLIWSHDGGRSISTANGNVDLRNTTLYGSPDNGMVQLDNPSDQGSFNQVLFYDLTGTDCAVGGMGSASGFDNWYRAAERSALGCLLVSLGGTFEQPTPNDADFSTFTRLPRNASVRSGWGEVSD